MIRLFVLFMAFITWLALPAGVGTAQPAASTQDLFRRMLASTPTLRGIAAEPARYRLQIIVGQIEAGQIAEGQPGDLSVRWHEYRPDAEYFYPASTVKLLAVAAVPGELRRLTREHGRPVTLDTPLVLHPLFEDDTLEERDESNTAGGAITPGHEIRKILLVSDNAAFNRLYELLGHDGLNIAARAMGLGSVRITHRLSEARSAQDNRRVPRIDLLTAEGKVTLPERTSTLTFDDPPGGPAPIPLGRGHMTSAGLVGEPLDFSDNNRVSLGDLLRLVLGIVRPEVAGGAGVDLTEAERAFVVRAMGELPRESANPVLDPAQYPDDWGKPLLPGVRRVLPAQRVRIYNKIGLAYGTVTDAAYILDTGTGRGVLVAVTIYTNDNAVLNDNVYEYDGVAFPALADIGEFVAREFLAREFLTSEPR
jgi:hypothetical protein